MSSGAITDGAIARLRGHRPQLSVEAVAQRVFARRRQSAVRGLRWRAAGALVFASALIGLAVQHQRLAQGDEYVTAIDGANVDSRIALATRVSANSGPATASDAGVLPADSAATGREHIDCAADAGNTGAVAVVRND
jgi:hypothetical protein